MTHTHIKKICCTSLICAALLSACAPPPSDDNVTAASGPVQFGYTNIPSDPLNYTKSISKIRLKAIEDTATGLGARGALAWRSQQIDTTLNKQAAYLDNIFDFNALMLPHNVLPAVIVQAQDLYHQDDADTVRLASKTYQILSPARFVTTPPTWRTYLTMPYKKPNLPNSALLPHNSAEITVWNNYYSIGWKNGLAQADNIFNQNLNRLKRDFNGIILYRKLYTQKMISAPYVSEADLGVTGDRNAIRINDHVLRITQDSGIQTNSSKWQSVLTQP